MIPLHPLPGIPFGSAHVLSILLAPSGSTWCKQLPMTWPSQKQKPSVLFPGHCHALFWLVVVGSGPFSWGPHKSRSFV